MGPSDRIMGFADEDASTGTISMLDKMVFVLLWFFLITGAWKFICNRVSVQDQLHKLPYHIVPVFQWYGIIFLCFFGLVCQIVKNTFYNDFYTGECLNPQRISATLSEKMMSDQQIDDLAIPPWLRYLSLSSIFAGIAAFGVLGTHFVQQCQFSAASADKSTGSMRDTRPWHFSIPQDTLLLVILTPAVFILMSMKSTSRMWMVMTGFHTGADSTTDKALFLENFELASVCQYITVLGFARLCFRVMKNNNSNEDVNKALSLVGFQGVYGWVLGSVHSGILFYTAYMKHNYVLYGISLSSVLKVAGMEPKVAFVAQIFSLQCAYNMMAICFLPLLKKELGNVNLKFNGTKMLLLLGPNQLKTLLLLTHSPGGGLKQQLASVLDLSEERAHLLHSSLMCFECLVVVILNYVSWMDVRGRSGSGIGEFLYVDDLNLETVEESKQKGYQLLDV